MVSSIQAYLGSVWRGVSTTVKGKYSTTNHNNVRINFLLLQSVLLLHISLHYIIAIYIHSVLSYCMHTEAIHIRIHLTG